MSRQIQIRRGTATENNNFTGAIGEVTMDTTNKTLRVHDGTTRGGNEIVSKNQFYSYITNCITEIPQDIKLTLASGTLTLKAGSKVYFPNGANTFDSVTITTDKTYSTTSADGKKVVFCNMAGNGLVISGLNNQCSGTTDSLTGTGFHFWYDTTNNTIKQYGADGVTQLLQGSFPIAIITYSNGAISSIDQVFNGFGYIGGTVFALPGLKGLFPNGRNADGTLKNISFVNSAVRTCQAPADGSLVYMFRNSSTQEMATYSIGYNNGGQGRNYCLSTNTIENASGTSVFSDRMFAAFVTVESLKITSFRPKLAFHAVDYSDSEYIAHQAMPSDRYINLTLGADASTYTAPADGYLYLSKVSTALGERIGFLDTTTGPGVMSYSSASGQTLMITLPIRKGQTIQIRYSAGGTTNAFKFIYANGAK